MARRLVELIGWEVGSARGLYFLGPGCIPQTHVRSRSQITRAFLVGNLLQHSLSL